MKLLYAATAVAFLAACGAGGHDPASILPPTAATVQGSAPVPVKTPTLTVTLSDCPPPGIPPLPGIPVDPSCPSPSPKPVPTPTDDPVTCNCGEYP